MIRHPFPHQPRQHHHPHTANNAISTLVQISSPRPLGLWGNCLPPDQPYIKVRYLEKNRKPKMPSDQTHIRVIFFSRNIGNREKMFEWESRGPSGPLDFVFSHTSYVREFAYLSDADIDDRWWPHYGTSMLINCYRLNSPSFSGLLWMR